jgi:hypothetical protein
MDKSLIDVLAERVGRLERENRRWKWIGGVALIGVLTLIAGGANQPGIVEAERIVLRDKVGKIRAVLEVKEDGTPRLALFDREANEGVELAVDSQVGSSLGLWCKQGASSIWALANNAGAAHVNLTVEDGQDLRLLSSGKDINLAELSLGPSAGPSQISLACAKGRSAGIEFDAVNGKEAPRIEMGTLPDGSVGLTVTDKDERPRLVLGAKTDGSPYLDLLDRNKDHLFQVPKP